MLDQSLAKLAAMQSRTATFPTTHFGLAARQVMAQGRKEFQDSGMTSYDLTEETIRDPAEACIAALKNFIRLNGTGMTPDPQLLLALGKVVDTMEQLLNNAGQVIAA